MREHLARPGRGNVDGLIHRNIDNFLTDRQKRHDPFGFAAFKNVEGALRLGIESGSLSVVYPKPGPVRIRNRTVLAIATLPVEVGAGPDGPIGDVLGEIAAWREALPRMFRVNVEVQRSLQRCWAPLARRPREGGLRRPRGTCQARGPSAWYGLACGRW